AEKERPVPTSKKRGVAWERKVYEGTTDASGLVRIEKIAKGDVDVTFPAEPADGYEGTAEIKEGATGGKADADGKDTDPAKDGKTGADGGTDAGGGTEG